MFQTIAGWHSRETNRKTETHKVSVTSVPAGADVVRRDPRGQEKTLGTAPLTDSIDYEVEVTTESPSALGVLLGAAVETAVGVGLIKGFSTSSSNTGFDVLGGFLIYFGVQDLLVGIIHGFSGTSVVGRKVSGGGQDYLYAAKKSGYPDALALIRIPDQGRAELLLDPGLGKGGTASGVTAGAPGSAAERGGASGGGAAPSGGGKRSLGASAVVAVMEVEDLNAGSSEKAVESGLVKNLGDQLRIFLAQQGVRTVDRGAQDRAVREQIEVMKKESYESCYDDACQIELGKALAASHILRSRITRFGKRCVLNAELIDLRSEVTMAASSAQGDCQAEGFLTMSESVATTLLAR